MAPKTMFEKIWESHVVHEEEGQPTVLYVDLHLVHEVTSPQAFDGLRMNNRKVRRPDLTVATADHNTPTWELTRPIVDSIAKAQLDALDRNCEEFGLTLFDRFSPLQGIVHVIGPEQGWTQPGKLRTRHHARRPDRDVKPKYVQDHLAQRPRQQMTSFEVVGNQLEQRRRFVGLGCPDRHPAAV